MRDLTPSPDAVFVFKNGARTTEKNWPQPPTQNVEVGGPDGNAAMRLVRSRTSDDVLPEQNIDLYCEEGMSDEEVARLSADVREK